MTSSETAQNIHRTSDPHIPVLLNEVIEALSPKDNGIYVDGTFGAGGYTRKILDTANCRVIAIDRDETVFDLAKSWSSLYGERLSLVHGSFSDVAGHIQSLGLQKIDGLVIDIGVSSMQIDQAERGFSFRFDGPLDMRMNRSEGQTAADLVNTLGEKELADIIYLYGEERHSRRIAAEIIRTRAVQSFSTTKELADAIRRVVPMSYKDKIDPATRTFQALRIAVNDELGELERVLQAAEQILNLNGRLVVVTFHSLEDRIVKNFLNERAKPASTPSRYMPITPDTEVPTFRLISKKPITASDDELSFNGRSRSAKLRVAEKISEPKIERGRA